MYIPSEVQYLDALALMIVQLMVEDCSVGHTLAEMHLHCHRVRILLDQSRKGI